MDVIKVEDRDTFDPNFSHDKLVSIANKMRNSSMGSATSFSGSDAITWLQSNAGTSENESVFLGQKMMDLGWFSRTGQPKTNAMFQNLSSYHFPRQLVLNMKQMCVDPPAESAIELSVSLLTRMIKLIYKNYDLHDDHPTTRDYLIFTQQVASKVKALEQYTELTYDVGQLQGISLNNLTNTQKIVFWTNVYNLICLHGAIELEAKYTWSTFFTQSCYSIAYEIYTLNDIENGILRGNAASVLISSKTPPFPEYDLRQMHSCEKPNPIFHFLKTCNTKSSPKLFVLTEENYESQLKEAAATFCSTFVQIEEERVVLPKLLSWFRADFGKSNIEVLKFIAECCEESQRTLLKEKIESGTFSVAYSSYDWSFAFPQISDSLKEMIVSVM